MRDTGSDDKRGLKVVTKQCERCEVARLEKSRLCWALSVGGERVNMGGSV